MKLPFAGDLFRMYERYSAMKNWNFQPMEKNETGLKGVKRRLLKSKVMVFLNF